MNRLAARLMLLTLLISPVAWTSRAAAVTPAHPAGTSVAAASPIHNFVYLMQGDRTFDNYFGTFPGADGIPANTCQKIFPSRPSSGCVQPFSLHGTSQQPLGAGTEEIAKQYDHGRLDGFVAAFSAQGRDGAVAMGHYDERDLASYWDLARRYVLFDRFFASTPEGVRANRSFWISGIPPAVVGARIRASSYQNQPTIFDRLQAAGVSWKFYVQDYNPQQTIRSATSGTQPVRVPLLEYPRFLDDPTLNSHIVDLNQYYDDLRNGNLPAVAYIATSGASERSAKSVPAGQRLVTDLVSQLMISPYWQSSAFLWSYDGSGGWFDHVVPPQVDRDGYGFRVPAVLVSPFAKAGQVNHTVLDSTSALAFIEKNWQLKPLAARDAAATSFASAFDFRADARPAQLPVSEAATGRSPLVSVDIIYWCYGAAAALTFALMLKALLRSMARSSKEPPQPDADAPEIGSDRAEVGST